MSLPNQAKRRIIPRWRSFDETASTLELASDDSTGAKRAVIESDDFLLRKQLEWAIEPSIGLAVDILSSALVLGRTKEFESIGWWVLTRPKADSYTSAVIELASLCAKGRAANLTRPHRQAIQARAFLRRSRGLLADNPFDAVLRVDMALAFALIGNIEGAEKQMAAAVKLAPDNRFVLRSAARFWVHNRDLQRARDILLKSERTPVDPWLLAAEISISGMVGKPPRFFSNARVALHERRLSPNHLSELAGTVGTLEALDGTRKNARNFFEQSLISPTENAVAQAVWAANERVLPGFSAEQFAHLHPAEAEAWQARAEMNWNGAITACHRWGDQEPFSLGPFAMGSFIGTMTDQYEETKAFCMMGLMANPNNFDLRNNYAVTLFFEGDVEAAIREMKGLRSMARTQQQSAVWSATSGLALFNTGNVEAGREFYRTAIETALKGTLRDTAVYAAAFWAKAEIACNGDPTEALDTFDQNAKGGNSPELQYFKDRFRPYRGIPGPNS